MKINKNLRNCYIKVRLNNILQVYPIAKLFPKTDKGHGSLTHTLDTWTSHLRASDDDSYYIIDGEGKLFYSIINKRDTRNRIHLEGKKELTNHNQLKETLQERIKNFKV